MHHTEYIILFICNIDIKITTFKGAWKCNVLAISENHDIPGKRLTTDQPTDKQKDMRPHREVTHTPKNEWRR